MSFLQHIINGVYALGAEHFYRQFIKDAKQAGAVNQAILKEIIKLNQDTVYGKMHRFSEIRNSKDYRKEIPLTQYADYETFIDEIAAGKEEVLTSEPVQYFGLSSGTTGKQKKIPTTARIRKIMNLNMMFTQYGLLRHAWPEARRKGKGLMLMNMLQSGTTSGGVPTGSGTSGGVQSMKKFLHYFWTTPLEVLEITDQTAANYLHLLYALQEKNLVYIMAPFASAIVQLAGVLEKDWPKLVHDLNEGRISEELPLKPDTRNLLNAQMKANPQRAKELEIQCRQGMKGIIQRIWPRMAYVTCVAGGSFSVYAEKLKDYIGELPVYSAVYGATEGLIGLASEVNKAEYVVTPRAAYYEFIPLKEAETSNPSTLELTKLIIGESYEIVLTNYAGFYRYRLGDVVKVAGYYYQSPILEFQYRKGQLLNVSGEKTSEQAVQQAISQSLQSLETRLEDYTVALDLSESIGYYHFYVESASIDIEALQANLQLYLEETNPRYRAGIEGKRISPLKVDRVKFGTFQQMRQELIRRGASLNQVKIPRLVKDKELIRLLENNLV